MKSSLMNTGLHIICPHCNTINQLPASRLEERPNCGKCHQALFNSKPVNLDTTQFTRYLEHNDIPVLVDFWAEWCGPCKMMAPQFASAAGLLEPKMRLAKVDIEAHSSLASRYAIQSIPMIVLFHRGKEIGRNAGVMGSQDLVRWVELQIKNMH